MSRGLLTPPPGHGIFQMKEWDWDVVEGWLHVWDMDSELQRRLFGQCRHFTSNWQPVFLYVTVRAGVLYFCPTEVDAKDVEESIIQEADGTWSTITTTVTPTTRQQQQLPPPSPLPQTPTTPSTPLTQPTAAASGSKAPHTSSTPGTTVWGVGVTMDKRLRLDEGKESFDRRWGYEWKELEPIQETGSPSIGEEASAESFFRARTHQDESSVGSLSDLQSPDSEAPRTPALLRRFIKDSSLDRVDGERRGSLPLVTGLHDSMESVSTTSRLAQFFSKKGFRSNLKRTKSVTKLENRKQSTPSLSEGAGPDTSSLMGSLKRTMSLGRLARKKKSKRDKENQQQQQHQHQPPSHLQQQRRASSTVSSRTNLINSPHSSPALSLISAHIRTARSHESLLTSSHPSMHSVNLSDPDVEVKPLHNSVLGQGHCFHVATAQGSKYVSCATSEERDKWMYSLRRTARPNEDHCRSSDSSLKLWVVEAKNLPAKKKYYCHVRLDRELYAQTSTKSMTDMLFWGEHFEFKYLPYVETVTINLFREADKKKKKDKDMLVGYINLTFEDLENRSMIEKWITCNSGTVGKAGKETKSELPIIRIKARRQKVDMLPLETYQSFIKYLTTDYLSICSMMESVLVVKEKEEFATSLVNILHTQGKASQFLCDVVMDEIDRLEDEHLTFRGNSIATKAMEAYMKLVGEKYLQDTLGEFIRNLMMSTEDCEVDPTKVGSQLLENQQCNLDMHCNMVWTKIINSCCYFPNEMREVFASLRTQCESRDKSDYSDNLISGCIFLRFLCPAILYPNLFHLTQEYPQEKVSRNLTLIAKTIQTLANFTKFGTKEEFMTFMNNFVEREEHNMKNFLHEISSQDAGNEFLQYDGHIDLRKELSVLHCMLLECREKYSQQTSGAEFEQMNNFLNTLSSAFNDPTIGQKKPNRKSQIYDNMMNAPGMPATQQPQPQLNSFPIDIEGSSRSEKSVAARSASNPMDIRAVPSSPTEVLRDMLRHCGESMDDLPALSENNSNSNVVSGNTLPLRDRSGSENMVLKSRSRSRSYSGDEEMKKAKEMAASSKGRSKRPEVADVSAASVGRVEASQEQINESWLQMVNAADNVNGDYIDLIPFMDEDVNDLSLDTMDAANTTTGSQASLGGRSSTVGSSGYQSFSHSQSPVESGSGQGGHNTESSAELAKSPVVQYPQSVQPLAFANPLFSHQQKHTHQHQQQPHHKPQQYSPHLHHHHAHRPPIVKSILNPPSGYAGATPSPIATTPQPTPRQRQAKTVQRRSSDEDDSSSTTSTDDENHTNTEHRKHPRKRGYKPPLRTTATTNPNVSVSATVTSITSDYQTSIAPLKKLSQLSSSSSDEEGSNGTPLGFHSSSSGSHRSYSSSSVNRQQQSKQYSSSSSVNKQPPSSSSKTHAYNKSSSTSSTSTSQFPPFSSSISTSSSSYQTTFPATNNNSNNNNNFTTINGCSTFPRKHARNKNFSYQDPNYVNIDNGTITGNTSSPPLPPREALNSSSSPAIPPKTVASRTAFLQRQISQQSYSSSTTDHPASSSTQRPAYPPRNPNSIGITTDKSGQFQVRQGATTSSTIAQRTQQLQHSLSVDGSNKYATTPRPTVTRKPQKLIQQFQQQQQQHQQQQQLQQPNKGSVETAIDSPPIEIGSYQSSPLLHSQKRFQNNKTTGANNSNIVNNSNNNNSTKTSWQVAKHMERRSSNSSSHDTSNSSSSTESSPQSLLRSTHHQKPNTNHNNSSTSMQDSSSTHSVSSAPLSSQSQPWGLTTPPQSDSSCSSLSSLNHAHNQLHPSQQRPNRSGSSGSLGGTGLPLELTNNQTGSASSLNNNTTSTRSGLNHIDNGLRQHSSSTVSGRNNNNNHYHNIPPPNSPNSNSSSFSSRLSSRSDGHINAISQQLSSAASLTSSFSVANPIPHSPSLGSNDNNSPPPTPSRSLSYHSPSGSPNLSGEGSHTHSTRSGGSSSRSSYPASRSMDLSTLISKKPTTVEAMKRTSVDSLLSHPDSSLSPSGSLSRDADTDGGRSSASSLSSSNRRLSPQSAVHMGISSVQRKLQEQEKTKKEYETEVHGLRQQLLEAQERLQQAEMRLLDHEVDTHSLMDKWQSRLTESEEKMRKQQEEKDEKMKEIITRLQSIEDELKQEQEEMAQAVEQKQQVIEVQEQRIRTLDLANQKLLLALAELKGRALATQKQSLNAGGNKELALEMAGLKTSSC